MRTRLTVHRVEHVTTITQITQLVGIEPTSMVLETTILPLNYSCITQTGIAGFEPTLKDSKSFVLPLDYIP